MNSMKTTIVYRGQSFTVDLSQPIDISIPLTSTDENPIAWYLDKPSIEPVSTDNWTGKVSAGASTNFNNIFFNPHGHGTHTECLGHITRDFYSVNKALTKFFFVAQVVSVDPEQNDGDLVITQSQLALALEGQPEALIIRTLPNEISKLSKKYSNTNPPYLHADAAHYARQCGVKHLLIDLPSVDREYDNGQLLAHKAFWNVSDTQKLNDDARHDATITELIFVPDSVVDGAYLLNLQIASFENDATPSRPVLYALIPN